MIFRILSQDLSFGSDINNPIIMNCDNLCDLVTCTQSTLQQKLLCNFKFTFAIKLNLNASLPGW